MTLSLLPSLQSIQSLNVSDSADERPPDMASPASTFPEVRLLGLADSACLVPLLLFLGEHMLSVASKL